MARRPFALPATAALACALILSGSPRAAAAPTADALTEAQFEAQEAERRLDELTALLGEGAEELSRLGEQVRRLDLDTAAALQARDAAARRGEAVAARVGEAEQRLAEVEGLLAERSDARAQRAVQLYKRGMAGGRGADLLGSLSASESDGFTDGLAYLEALFVADAARQEAVEAVIAVAEAARVRLVGLREDARLQEAAAAQAAALAEGLRTEQAQVASAVGSQQQRRVALLGSLEADLAARDALVRRLESTGGTLGLPGEDLGDEWVGRLPEAGREWGPQIVVAAGAAPIDPRLLAAVAWTESNFRPSVVSPAGAVGLCQLLPSTADLLGVDPWNPEDNLLGGARYLRQLLDRYPGRPELAIAAYNAGPGRVDDAGAIPDIPETQAYVARVLARYGELTQE